MSSGLNFHRFAGSSLASLETFGLFRVGDVQPELDDLRVRLAEMALEVVDRSVPRPPPAAGAARCARHKKSWRRSSSLGALKDVTRTPTGFTPRNT
jgi:hypothetical protein